MSIAATTPNLSSAGWNRATIACAGFCMQIALGAVYGWSVFLVPLQEHFGASKGEVNLTFTITLVALGITAGFGGGLQRRIGPRSAGIIAGLLYGSGVMMSGFAPTLGIFYITYGILAGIGLGIGYILPLTVLIRWFPDRRGFITGLTVTGFGLGAFLTGPVSVFLIEAVGIQWTMVLLGAAYLVVVVSAAQALTSAPDGFVPAGWRSSAGPMQGEGHDLCLGKALRSPCWYLLWLMLAINVTAGAALISIAAPLAREITGVGVAMSTLLVSAISLCNGAGRILWGTFSDHFGRRGTILLILILQVPAFMMIPRMTGFATLLIPVALVALCYGGGFGVMPAFTTDLFGSQHSGTVYGAMLTAWSAGAIVGPLAVSMMPYSQSFSIIAGLLLFGALLAAIFPLVPRVTTKVESEFA